ncbi:MAG TPA: PGPGW domain-containing protein [Polyangiaceae bacterium]|nr:PGPGW domain-containing protein [Polyangiaceae bacterium]
MPEWLVRWLPDWASALLEPLLEPKVLTGLALFSVVTFFASVIGVPYFFTRLPADYFTHRERAALGIEEPRLPPWRILLRVLKNVLGVILVCLGVLFLVLPGQGVLTILVGVFFLDFPGKRRFERWLIARPPVFRAINALRHRAGRPSLERRGSWPVPGAHEDHEDRTA